MRLSPSENLKQAAAVSKKKLSDAMAIISYDEKPGIQAIATTAPDLPPEPGVHATFAREHEYKRHGTISLLAGIDLVTGKVHALVKDRHRSREFIEFLKLLDAAYPAHTAIKSILDNHSAHISKETEAWLADQPAHRFEFTFTPKHGSWLNLVEGFFSKLARPSSATSASRPNRNSRIGSWLPWTISIRSPSFTPGPISSTRRPEMISNFENAGLGLGNPCDVRDSVGLCLTRAFLCAPAALANILAEHFKHWKSPGYKIRRATSRSCAAAKLLPRDEGSHLQCICKVGHSP